MLSLFQQTTFVNGITFFSNEIYTQGKKGNSAERLARIGTLLLGIAATLGATSSMFMWKYIKRTHFILISEIIMAASLGLSGIFALVGSQAGIITFTLVHMFAFSWGFGPTLWIYCSEVLDSFGFSVIGVINMFSIWTFATFANLLFKFLHSSRDVFWTCCSSNSVHFICMEMCQRDNGEDKRGIGKIIFWLKSLLFLKRIKHIMAY